MLNTTFLIFGFYVRQGIPTITILEFQINPVQISLRLRLIPLITEVILHRRLLRTLGFREPVDSKPAIFITGFGFFTGLFVFLFEPHTPTPVLRLVYGIVFPRSGSTVFLFKINLRG